MNPIITYKIYLHTYQTNEDSTNTVYLRASQYRSSKVFSLSIKVLQKDWNEKKARVKTSDFDHVRKNQYLAKYEQKVRSIIDKYFFANKPLTLQIFAALWKNFNSTESFIEYVNSKLKKETFTSAETLKTYRSQITKLQKFKIDVRFSDITHDFLNAYKAFCLSLGNSIGTANKSLSMLRTFVHWAIDDEYIKDNPFAKIKIQKKPGNRVALTMEELRKLQNYMNEENHLQPWEFNVLQIFLFACFTGLRYGDVKALSVSDTQNNWIRLEMKKTKEFLKVPIIPDAQQIIDKYRVEGQHYIFHVPTNQKVNEALKVVMKIVGIRKNISFHCARHTFATLSAEQGIPVEVLQRLLGHTNISTTMLYTKVLDSRLIDSMNAWIKN